MEQSGNRVFALRAEKCQDGMLQRLPCRTDRPGAGGCAQVLEQTPDRTLVQLDSQLGLGQAAPGVQHPQTNIELKLLRITDSARSK